MRWRSCAATSPMHAATERMHERLSRSRRQADGVRAARAPPGAFRLAWPAFLKNAVPDILLPAGFAVAVLLLWELSVRLFDVPAFVLPGPLQFLSVLANRFDAIAGMAMQTARSTIIGFAAGVTVGLTIGGLIGSSRSLYDMINPTLIGFNAIPSVALDPPVRRLVRRRVRTSPCSLRRWSASSRSR